MLKKTFLFLLFSSIFVTTTIYATPKKTPNIVILSIGVNKRVTPENDVFAREASYFENSITRRCSSLYSIKKMSLYSDKATKRACLEAIDWVVNTVEEGDLAIVYIGSHGSNKKGYYEFFSYNDSVTSSEIISKLRKIKCNLILVVDTCHAGAIIFDWKNLSDNIVILTACRNDQYAYSWKFVKPFEDAFSFADSNGDGFIDIDEISDYVTIKVEPIQTPVIIGKSKRVIAPSQILGSTN